MAWQRINCSHIHAVYSYSAMSHDNHMKTWRESDSIWCDKIQKQSPQTHSLLEGGIWKFYMDMTNGQSNDEQLECTWDKDQSGVNINCASLG